MTFPKRHALIAAAVGGATLIPAGQAAAVGPVTIQAETIAPVTRMAVRAHARAVHRNVKLKRTNARLKGRTPHRHSPDVSDWSLEHLSDANRHLKRSNGKLRRAARKHAAAQPAAVAATPGNLQAIAACESGGNPSAVDASGTYRGKYQFDQQTWQSVGGSGDPAAAPEAEQDARAAQLYAQSGSNPWPVCGQ